ncbi:MAG: RhuM family protein [Candidatus Delongbacteria bacterium]|jgi:hypothetical protein|nr:RhuM family protein [Candidatus Delongbacteria bacterium]
MKNEIIIYQRDELTSRIDVRIEAESVWLNLKQITELFDRDKSVISRHISNVFKECELEKALVVAKYATTATDRKTYQIEYYNLDVIISVGYRVKSKQGTQFRIWANKILKNYLLKGYVLNNIMNRIEDNVESLSKRVNKIDLQIQTELPPKQGIFFQGQVFDAYKFVSDIFRSAKRSILIIDNYIDDTVLIHLTKAKKNIDIKILTSRIPENLKLDLKKYEKQHFKIEVRVFKKSHDRFIITDNEVVYHFGASLKDLGNKLFAFSRIDKDLLNLEKLMLLS